jgi:hypothetical protein
VRLRVLPVVGACPHSCSPLSGNSKHGVIPLTTYLRTYKARKLCRQHCTRRRCELPSLGFSSSCRLDAAALSLTGAGPPLRRWETMWTSR